MFVLGITGRAGSGKSFAVDYLLRYFSVFVLDLDVIGHQLLLEPDIRLTIVRAFGVSVLDDPTDMQALISRPKLGKLVFSDSDQLKRLNAIMHPRMRSYVQDQLLLKEASHYVIVGALLTEIDVASLCDVICVIDASDQDLQVHSSRFHIAQIQASREAYIQRGDVCVLNDFSTQFEDRLMDVFTCYFEKKRV